MSVIDLSQRTTSDWLEYNNCTAQIDSKIFVSENVIFDNDGAQCINFTVGSRYLKNNKLISIGNDGVIIQPHDVLVVETQQLIALPYNMYGLVFGYGTNIFRGCFVSTGKIDPGFKGFLKIGFYNGNETRIKLKKGDVIASASFWDIETAMSYPLQNYHSDPVPIVENQSITKKVFSWVIKNWYSLLALIISILTLLFTVRGSR